MKRIKGVGNDSHFLSVTGVAVAEEYWGCASGRCVV